MDWLSKDAFLSAAMGREAWNVAALPHVGSEANFLRECATKRGAAHFFASAKAPAKAMPAVDLLTEAGFRLVDTNLRFERPIQTCTSPAWTGIVRFAVPADEHKVRKIAAASLTTSRFHLDPRIPDGLAAKVKSEWAGNFFTGSRGHSMVVAEEDGKHAGFLLLLSSGNTLVIDLLAVDAPFRRRGAAAAMIGFAETRLSGFDRIQVGTQAANTGSVLFYESQGFRFAAATYVLHAHGGTDASR